MPTALSQKTEPRPLSDGDIKHLAALDAARDEIIRRMGLRPEIIPTHLRPKFFERNI
jgi:hypothetical protein